MSACRSFVIILLSLLVSLTEVLLSRNVYDNEIVIRILGGSEVAQLLAMEMGYTYRGHVSINCTIRVVFKLGFYGKFVWR